MGNIQLPSLNIVELIILAIIAVGTIIYAIVTFREHKSQLRIQVSKCTHTVRHVNPSSQNEIAGTEIISNFIIHNTGARTSIYNIEIQCKPLGQPYRTTERVQSEHSIVVRKGDTIDYSHQFYIPRREVTEPQLICTFFLHHTFGKATVKAYSTFQR